MGFEIPIDVDYFDHPKTAALVAKIGKHADIFPLRLWAWCARFAKDGHPGSPGLTERVCRWTGKPDLLYSALVECGFIDKDGKVHDWDDHTGRKVAAYEKQKERQRQSYRKENVDDLCKDPPASSRLETKRNETKENETKREDTTASPRPRATVGFVKPSIEEIKAYCLERKNSVDPERFWNYYESNGWRVGKNAMKSWKAAVHTWEKNDIGGGNGKARRPAHRAGGAGFGDFVPGTKYPVADDPGDGGEALAGGSD